MDIQRAYSGCATVHCSVVKLRIHTTEKTVARLGGMQERVRAKWVVHASISEVIKSIKHEQQEDNQLNNKAGARA